MEAASINPADLHLIRGLYGVRPQLPAPLGAEGVGRVIGVGSPTDNALVGRRVAVLFGHRHGTCAAEVRGTFITPSLPRLKRQPPRVVAGYRDGRSAVVCPDADSAGPLDGDAGVPRAMVVVRVDCPTRVRVAARMVCRRPASAV